jgi:serine/threonine protein kinase
LDVLSGLSYLHRNNVVHGDIKGENVLVDSQGRACIADLGLSRLTSDAQISQIDTWMPIDPTDVTDVTYGSLLWRAPELLSEQFRDLGRIPSPTTFSDIYALGCLAYEVGHATA